MTASPHTLVLLASLAFLAVPRTAAAQARGPAAADSPRSAAPQKRDAAAADSLFQSAREAMARGEIPTACSRFAESQRLDPAPGTLLNLAQCEEKEGKLATSYAHLSEALEGLPKDDFRVPYARTQLTALKPRVPTVTLTLAAGRSIAHVSRDDLELREGSFGVPLPLDPGRHTFVVRSTGLQDQREEITLREGEHASLTLGLGTAAAPETHGVPGHEEEGDGGGRRTMAIGAFAIGGAGIVTGIVTGILFANAASTYQSRCPADACDAEGLSAASRAKTLNVISPVAFGIGALGAGVGTVLLLTSKRAAPRQGALQIAPQVSPQIAGLTLVGGF